jgi:hypothetical protein
MHSGQRLVVVGVGKRNWGLKVAVTVQQQVVHIERWLFYSSV